jgi:hypothetical protein
MADDGPMATDDIALVPGELRGFRQFSLKADGLYPLVHTSCGPWDGRLQRAVCATGAHHASPATSCLCGLYAWYQPGSATVSLGPVSAVVAARGRCVLGDRGFRAASARIEAVSLPAAVRWHPAAAARARTMLAQRYPQTRVYPSTRRMLRDHPPQDVSALGVNPPRDRSRGYRAAAAALWVAFVLGAYALVAVPRAAVTEAAAHWWPMLVLGTIAWQAALVWLFLRLMAEQMPSPRWGRKEH